MPSSQLTGSLGQVPYGKCIIQTLSSKTPNY